MHKVCKDCGLSKSLDDFHRKTLAKDGRQTRCKPCAIALACVSQKAQPEQRKQINQKYRERNPEAHKASDAKWRAKDPERAAKLDAEKARKWRASNKAKVREWTSARRKAAVQATCSWGLPQMIAVVYQKAQELKMEVDHIVPLRSKEVCGLHVWFNLQLLDPKANKAKGNREWPNMVERT